MAHPCDLPFFSAPSAGDQDPRGQWDQDRRSEELRYRGQADSESNEPTDEHELWDGDDSSFYDECAQREAEVEELMRQWESTNHSFDEDPQGGMPWRRSEEDDEQKEELHSEFGEALEEPQGRCNHTGDHHRRRGGRPSSPHRHGSEEGAVDVEPRREHPAHGFEDFNHSEEPDNCQARFVSDEIEDVDQQWVDHRDERKREDYGYEFSDRAGMGNRGSADENEGGHEGAEGENEDIAPQQRRSVDDAERERQESEDLKWAEEDAQIRELERQLRALRHTRILRERDKPALPVIAEAACDDPALVDVLSLVGGPLYEDADGDVANGFFVEWLPSGDFIEAFGLRRHETEEEAEERREKEDEERAKQKLDLIMAKRTRREVQNLDSGFLSPPPLRKAQRPRYVERMEMRRRADASKRGSDVPGRARSGDHDEQVQSPHQDTEPLAEPLIVDANPGADGPLAAAALPDGSLCEDSDGDIAHAFMEEVPGAEGLVHRGSPRRCGVREGVGRRCGERSGGRSAPGCACMEDHSVDSGIPSEGFRSDEPTDVGCLGTGTAELREMVGGPGEDGQDESVEPQPRGQKAQEADDAEGEDGLTVEGADARSEAASARRWTPPKRRQARELHAHGPLPHERDGEVTVTETGAGSRDASDGEGALVTGDGEKSLDATGRSHELGHERMKTCGLIEVDDGRATSPDHPEPAVASQQLREDEAAEHPSHTARTEQMTCPGQDWPPEPGEAGTSQQHGDEEMAGAQTTPGAPHSPGADGGVGHRQLDAEGGQAAARGQGGGPGPPAATAEEQGGHTGEEGSTLEAPHVQEETPDKEDDAPHVQKEVPGEPGDVKHQHDAAQGDAQHAPKEAPREGGDARHQHDTGPGEAPHVQQTATNEGEDATQQHDNAPGEAPHGPQEGRPEESPEACEPEMEEMAAWEVVGGQTTGGVLVRTMYDLKSPEAIPPRLAVGAVVREVELSGIRLHFELVSGDGPRSGWVSIKLKDKDLLTRTIIRVAKTRAQAAAPETLELNLAQFYDFVKANSKLSTGKFWDLLYKEGLQAPTLRAGNVVEVVGLMGESSRKFNGMMGRLTKQKDDDGEEGYRWVVRFHDNREIAVLTKHLVPWRRAESSSGAAGAKESLTPEAKDGSEATPTVAEAPTEAKASPPPPPNVRPTESTQHREEAKPMPPADGNRKTAAEKEFEAYMQHAKRRADENKARTQKAHSNLLNSLDDKVEARVHRADFEAQRKREEDEQDLQCQQEYDRFQKEFQEFKLLEARRKNAEKAREARAARVTRHMDWSTQLEREQDEEEKENKTNMDAGSFWQAGLSKRPSTAPQADEREVFESQANKVQEIYVGDDDDGGCDDDSDPAVEAQHFFIGSEPETECEDEDAAEGGLSDRGAHMPPSGTPEDTAAGDRWFTDDVYDQSSDLNRSGVDGIWHEFSPGSARKLQEVEEARRHQAELEHWQREKEEEAERLRAEAERQTRREEVERRRREEEEEAERRARRGEMERRRREEEEAQRLEEEKAEKQRAETERQRREEEAQARQLREEAERRAQREEVERRRREDEVAQRERLERERAEEAARAQEAEAERLRDVRAKREREEEECRQREAQVRRLREEAERRAQCEEMERRRAEEAREARKREAEAQRLSEERSRREREETEQREKAQQEEATRRWAGRAKDKARAEEPVADTSEDDAQPLSGTPKRYLGTAGQTADLQPWEAFPIDIDDDEPAGPPLDGFAQPCAFEETHAHYVPGGPTWEVVGGNNFSGALVQTGIELYSPIASPAHLSIGAVVAEVERAGSRLCFELVSGDGPCIGWVSTSFKGKELLVRKGAAESPVGIGAAPCAPSGPSQSRSRRPHYGRVDDADDASTDVPSPGDCPPSGVSTPGTGEARRGQGVEERSPGRGAAARQRFMQQQATHAQDGRGEPGPSERPDILGALGVEEIEV